MEKTFKVSKLIADAGICSRRNAEKLVREGKVKLNNKTLGNVAERATIRDKEWGIKKQRLLKKNSI